MKRATALIAHVGKATSDGRTIDEVIVEPEKFVPIFDGRPGRAPSGRLFVREMIGQARITLEGDSGSDVVAHMEIYDDAMAALLAPNTSLRLVADMRGEIVPEDKEVYQLHVFTEPEQRHHPRWRMVGEVGSITLTPTPAWDDLWVREGAS